MSIEAPVFTPPVEPGQQPPQQRSTGGESAVPSTCMFSWEEPPPIAGRGKRVGRTGAQLDWFRNEVLPQLQAHPGQYAKVFSYDKRSSAAGRVARLRQQWPGIHFLSRASGLIDGQPEQPEWSAVYAAWSGDDSDTIEQPTE